METLNARRQKKLGVPYPPLGRYWGSKKFFPHLLPQKSQVRFPQFCNTFLDGRRTIGPENLVIVLPKLLRNFVKPMLKNSSVYTRYANPLIRSLFILLDTPSHSLSSFYLNRDIGRRDSSISVNARVQ